MPVITGFKPSTLFGFFVIFAKASKAFEKCREFYFILFFQHLNREFKLLRNT